MNKNIIKKSIPVIILFMIFLFVLLSPFKSNAAGISWDAPNKNSANPYQFTLKNLKNSAAPLMTQVVGCTGVTNKVSRAITDFPAKTAKKIIDKRIADSKVKNCDAVVKGFTSSVAVLGREFVAAITGVKPCEELGKTQPTNDKAAEEEIKKLNDSIAAIDRTNNCLNGIAKTFAKNQLTSMTKYTMNWVTSGFSGDPMYVRNIDSFMGRMTDDILMKELEMFKGQPSYYPYGNNYYRGAVLGNISLNNFKDSMKQNLSNYLESGSLGNDAADVVEKYTNNFGEGGWNGWLAFTQYPQNNYLGYSMKSSEYIASEQNKKIEDIKDQQTRNGGILDQRKCEEFGTTIKTTFDANGKATMKVEEDKTKCNKWETVTPGSLIKDRVSTVMNSDIRQLELAKDINDSLNAVFSILLQKLQNNGLTSLSTEDTNCDPNSEFGCSNYNNVLDEVDANGNIVRSSGAGFNGSFDITKELGNTFTHSYNPTSLGNWNANTNSPALYPGFGTPGRYYTVSVAGKTKLINNGYNGWEVGDRAYFDGEEWQNWKKGTANPIEKRGIIQIQKDYIVAAKEALRALPGVMPKIGELDYCIPGPNPSWEANIEDTSGAVRDYVNTTSTSYSGNGFTRIQEEKSTWRYYMASIGDPEYENYKKLFKGAEEWWDSIVNTYDFAALKDKTWPNETGERETETSRNFFARQVETLLSRINSHFDQFIPTYDKLINENYGPQSPMQNEFVKSEIAGIKIGADGKPVKNPGYIPMAQAGLEITKDMTSYDEQIKESIYDYNLSISEADANVSKLESIKKEVSVIIAEAQARRAATLLEQLKKEGNNLTEAQYKIKYKECLDEENVVFYDEDSIMNDNNSMGENCSDNIDNDLNGLIDNNDPSCPGYTAPNTSGSWGASTVGGIGGSGSRR